MQASGVWRAGCAIDGAVSAVTEPYKPCIPRCMRGQQLENGCVCLPQYKALHTDDFCFRSARHQRGRMCRSTQTYGAKRRSHTRQLDVASGAARLHCQYATAYSGVVQHVVQRIAADSRTARQHRGVSVRPRRTVAMRAAAVAVGPAVAAASHDCLHRAPRPSSILPHTGSCLQRARPHALAACAAGRRWQAAAAARGRAAAASTRAVITHARTRSLQQHSSTRSARCVLHCSTTYLGRSLITRESHIARSNPSISHSALASDSTSSLPIVSRPALHRAAPHSLSILTRPFRSHTDVWPFRSRGPSESTPAVPPLLLLSHPHNASGAAVARC